MVKKTLVFDDVHSVTVDVMVSYSTLQKMWAAEPGSPEQIEHFAACTDKEFDELNEWPFVYVMGAMQAYGDLLAPFAPKA